MRWFCHAGAVILLGGWLLMWPYQEDNIAGGHLNTGPIEQWEVLSAFDHATECEDARTNSQLIATEALDPRWKAARRAQCVPAEHIYRPDGTPRRQDCWCWCGSGQ